MDRNKKRCFACGQSATEEDHFPIPKRYGGMTTVPLCRGCHDSKDRIPMAHWPVEEIWNSAASLWAKANASERRFIMKIVVLLATIAHEPSSLIYPILRQIKQRVLSL